MMFLVPRMFDSIFWLIFKAEGTATESLRGQWMKMSFDD